MKEKEKIKIYRDKFPSIISERMISQFQSKTEINGEYRSTQSLPDLIDDFSNWRETYEGYGFWEDIYLLDWENLKKEDLIKSIIFIHTKHGIGL